MSASKQPQSIDPHYARLDQRVTGLETAVNGIAENINGLGDKLDNRSRPQWMLIVGALGLCVTLLGVVGAGWKDPIERIIARQETDLRLLEQSVVPRVEIDNLRAYTAQERDEMRGRLDRLEGWMLESARAQ